MRVHPVIALLVPLLLLALPTEAEAGRRVRLMFDPPPPTAGEARVYVTFSNDREPKKGGAEIDLIAQERQGFSAMGMIPKGVFSGAKDTAHIDGVIPQWTVDHLRAAGYAAQLEEDPSLPRVHISVTKLWGDGVPPRINFTFGSQVSVYPPGATEPAYTVPLTASAGVTSIINIEDPFEKGFVRVLAEAGKYLLMLVASDPFQAALPGGDVEAAKAKMESYGQDDQAGVLTGQDAAAAQESGSSVTAGGTSDSTRCGLTEEDLAGPYKTWDPCVYFWGGKSSIGALVFGGVSVGLLIGGDQWARKLAVDLDPNLDTTLSPVLSTLSSAAHIPLTDPDPDVGHAIQSYVSDYMFLFGIQGTVPSFAGTIPSLIVASTGADIQTMKAVAGISALPAFLPAGIAHLARFGNVFVPHLQLNQANGDRWLHVAPAVAALAAGIADIAVGSVQFVLGVLYAGNVLDADPLVPGIFPSKEGNLRNTGVGLLVAPTLDGGVTLGLFGTF